MQPGFVGSLQEGLQEDGSIFRQKQMWSQLHCSSGWGLQCQVASANLSNLHDLVSLQGSARASFPMWLSRDFRLKCMSWDCVSAYFYIPDLCASISSETRWQRLCWFYPEWNYNLNLTENVFSVLLWNESKILNISMYCLFIFLV